jgi:hypothetical protein
MSVIRVGARDFSHLQNVLALSGRGTLSNQLLGIEGTAAACHAPPHSAEVKHAWNCILLLLYSYVLMACSWTFSTLTFQVPLPYCERRTLYLLRLSVRMKLLGSFGSILVKSQEN